MRASNLEVKTKDSVITYYFILLKYKIARISELDLFKQINKIWNNHQYAARECVHLPISKYIGD